MAIIGKFVMHAVSVEAQIRLALAATALHFLDFFLMCVECVVEMERHVSLDATENLSQTKLWMCAACAEEMEPLA